MTTISGSAKNYQERRQPELRNTRRLPAPRSDVRANLADNAILEIPLPLVETLFAEDHAPPDAGLTKVWPWEGTEEF